MAEVTFSWEERALEVMYLDVVAFVATADVSNYLVGQVNITLNNRSGWNTASITLANADDVWVYTPEQALAVRKALDSKSKIDETKFRTAARDFRYSEAGKLQVAKVKSTSINVRDKEADLYRWEPHPGSACFDKYDPIRLFLHDPRVAETDSHTPAWIPIFTGFLENRTLEDDYINGQRRLIITAHDIRYFLTRMRTDVNAFTGMHMGNRLVKISETFFQDVNQGSRYGHALPSTTLEDAVQYLVIGGAISIKDLDADGVPKKTAKLRKNNFTGIGRFKLGQIVQLNPAKTPVGGVKEQIKQLTDGKGGDVVIDGKTSKNAARDRAIAAAKQRNEEARTKLQEAAKDLRDKITKAQSGGPVTPADRAAISAAREKLRSIQMEVGATDAEVAAASAVPDNEVLATPQAVPSEYVSVIPELNTDLDTKEVLKLEKWYALGLFGDWEDDLKDQIAKRQENQGLKKTTNKPPGSTASTPTPAPRQDQQTDADGKPLFDSVTGQPLYKPGSINASHLASQSKGDPNTTTTGASQRQAPNRQNLGPSSTINQIAPEDGSSVDEERAAAGGAKTGEARLRPLTWFEMNTIGQGTFWDGAFDPTAKRLYILVPAGGTGNKNFADATSPQGVGFHDRNWVTRKDVIDQFLSGIDYQWWCSGSGDIFVEPSMLDFQPDDFGKFAGVMKAERHLIRATIGDEHGDVPSVVQAVGAAQNPLAGNIPTFSTVRSQVVIPLAVRRFGIEIKVVSFPFMGNTKILAAAAMVELNKAIAHANNMDVGFAYRPYLLPNKPFYHRVRFRMGTTTAINHTITIFGPAQTRAGLDHVRRQRFDGRFVLLTGGYDSPISGRRILPADTVHGPPRTGARTNIDAQSDPGLGIDESKVSQKDLNNTQIKDDIDAGIDLNTEVVA